MERKQCGGPADDEPRPAAGWTPAHPHQREGRGQLQLQRRWGGAAADCGGLSWMFVFTNNSAWPGPCLLRCCVRATLAHCCLIILIKENNAHNICIQLLSNRCIIYRYYYFISTRNLGRPWVGVVVDMVKISCNELKLEVSRNVDCSIWGFANFIPQEIRS